MTRCRRGRRTRPLRPSRGGGPDRGRRASRRARPTADRSPPIRACSACWRSSDLRHGRAVFAFSRPRSASTRGLDQQMQVDGIASDHDPRRGIRADGGWMPPMARYFAAGGIPRHRPLISARSSPASCSAHLQRRPRGRRHVQAGVRRRRPLRGRHIALQQLFIAAAELRARDDVERNDAGACSCRCSMKNFFARLLGCDRSVPIWWIVSLAIGAGVLYKRKTRSNRHDAARPLRGDRIDVAAALTACWEQRSRMTREEDPDHHRRRARRRGGRRAPTSDAARHGHRHHRGHQDPRPRGHRVGVRQDSAEAARQHQRRHARAASSSSRSTKATASTRAIPAADRSRSRSDARRQRHRVARRGRASLEQSRQSVQTARVQLEQASAQPRAPARAVEPAAHHARSARAGRERGARRRIDAAGARKGRSPRRRAASSRSAPGSRAPATT